MIRTEMLADGRIRTYSDAGYRIRQTATGVVYDDAIDNVPHEYTETDEPIPAPDDDSVPAWDITQGEYINEGDLVSRGGITYRCIKGHYAAWSKQPPNEEYWEEEEPI